MEKNKKLGIGISIAVLGSVLGVTVLHTKNATPIAAVATPMIPSPVSSSDKNKPQDLIVLDTVKKKVLGYKDGTYTAVGSYMSPGGLDNIGVTLTLKNDVITSVSVDPHPGDGTSSRYMNIFATNYQPYVLGKDISTLSLGNVSRSSLTPHGFNDAIAKIRTQAKA